MPALQLSQPSRRSRRSSALFAACLLVAVTGGQVSAVEAKESSSAKKAVSSAAAPSKGPVLTIGAQSDTADGLQLSDVTILYPGASPVAVAVKAITVKAASGNGPDSLAADEIRLSGVSVTSKTSPAVTVSLDSAVLTGVSAPPPRAETFNVAGKPGDLPALMDWLLSLKAASIQVPTIRVHAGRGSDSTDVVYRDLALTGVDAGRILGIAIAGAEQTLAVSGKTSAPAKVTIGRISADDVDLNAYAAWFDDDRAGTAPATKRTLYRDIAVDGVSFAGEGTVVSLGSIAVNAVKLGPPAGKPSRMMALLAETGATDKPSPKQQAELAEVVRGMLNAFEIGSFEMKALKVVPPSQPPVSIGSLRMSDFAGASLGELRLDGLDATGGDGTAVKLGSFSVRGFRIEKLDEALQRIAAGSDPQKWSPDQYPQPRLAGVSISGVETTVPGKGRFSLGALSIDLPSWIGFAATALKIHLQDLQVPTSAVDDERTKAQLTDLGLQTVSVSGESDSAWHEDGTLSFGPTSLDVKGVGRAEIGGSLGGIPRTVFEHPETAQEALASLDVRQLSLKLQDGGSFAKLMDQTAAQQNTTRPAMAQQTSQMVEGAMIMMLGMQEAGHQLGEALRTFITDPKSLAVTLTAAEPIPALALGAITQGDQATLELIRKSVKVEAEANK